MELLQIPSHFAVNDWVRAKVSTDAEVLREVGIVLGFRDRECDCLISFSATGPSGSWRRSSDFEIANRESRVTSAPAECPPPLDFEELRSGAEAAAVEMGYRLIDARISDGAGGMALHFHFDTDGRLVSAEVFVDAELIEEAGVSLRTFARRAVRAALGEPVERPR